MGWGGGGGGGGAIVFRARSAKRIQWFVGEQGCQSLLIVSTHR